jgi:hypothetical protein
MRDIVKNDGSYCLTKGKSTPDKDKNAELDREFLKTSATCALLKLATSRAYDKLVCDTRFFLLIRRSLLKTSK